jgi:hypothetical protein
MNGRGNLSPAAPNMGGEAEAPKAAGAEAAGDPNRPVGAVCCGGPAEAFFTPC